MIEIVWSVPSVIDLVVEEELAAAVVVAVVVVFAGDVDALIVLLAFDFVQVLCLETDHCRKIEILDPMRSYEDLPNLNLAFLVFFFLFGASVRR